MLARRVTPAVMAVSVEERAAPSCSGVQPQEERHGASNPHPHPTHRAPSTVCALRHDPVRNRQAGVRLAVLSVR